MRSISARSSPSRWHLLAILVVLFAGMLAMQFDVTGYDTWLPDREDITAVDINVVTTPQLTDPANIDAVYSLMEPGRAGGAKWYKCHDGQ